jgi:aspartyl-tRNA(Asn)/glutamyl-tRNA(Gln) amidotransferase subunit C
VLDRETVEKVSKLARLKLNENEISAFAEQLTNVLANFETIAQVETSGVRPLVTPTDMSVQLRADEPSGSASYPGSYPGSEADNEKLLENAPEKMGRLFKVPPVV